MNRSPPCAASVPCYQVPCACLFSSCGCAQTGRCGPRVLILPREIYFIAPGSLLWHTCIARGFRMWIFGSAEQPARGVDVEVARGRRGASCFVAGARTGEARLLSFSLVFWSKSLLLMNITKSLTHKVTHSKLSQRVGSPSRAHSTRPSCST